FLDIHEIGPARDRKVVDRRSACKLALREFARCVGRETRQVDSRVPLVRSRPKARQRFQAPAAQPLDRPAGTLARPWQGHTPESTDAPGRAPPRAPLTLLPTSGWRDVGRGLWPPRQEPASLPLPKAPTRVSLATSPPKPVQRLFARRCHWSFLSRPSLGPNFVPGEGLLPSARRLRPLTP